MAIKNAKIICVLLLFTVTDGSYVERTTMRINSIPDTDTDTKKDQEASILRAPNSCPRGERFQFGRCRVVVYSKGTSNLKNF